MTRVFTRLVAGGGTRLLVLGAAHYPFAQAPQPGVPQLDDISSAGQSALDFAAGAIGRWADRFVPALQSVDLLVNATDQAPVFFNLPGQAPIPLDPPDLPNIRSARDRWLAGAGPDDMLVFYCCGHGIWLPSGSRTFLTTNFGEDPLEPWSNAVSLDDFKFGLGDVLPRVQWLLFDCCANTPLPAVGAQGPRGNPLLQAQIGRRGAVEQALGRSLAQVTVASAPLGAAAFGKPGRASRFMEVLIDACDNAGYRNQDENGRWVLDQASLESAFESYALRVAPPHEERYFTFTRMTTTDAAETPRLMARNEPPTCMLLVSSEPPERLTRCDLSIHVEQPRSYVGGQPGGAGALPRFRQTVQPWVNYRVEAMFPEGSEIRLPFAQPPLARAKFT